MQARENAGTRVLRDDAAVRQSDFLERVLVKTTWMMVRSYIGQGYLDASPIFSALVDNTKNLDNFLPLQIVHHHIPSHPNPPPPKPPHLALMPGRHCPLCFS